MLLWLNGAPFLIQVISGGGIPVAEQVKVTGSFSFTVYVKPSSTGKVMLGMTGGDSNSDKSQKRFPNENKCM